MIPLRDSVRSSTFPLVNYILIAFNVVVFMLELSMGDAAEELVYRFGLVPYAFLNAFGPHEAGTLVTCMFLHAGWAHLIFNMLALYIFGDNIEDRMGPARYLVFYLACGILAGLAHVAFNPGSRVPTIGASGAIAGVLGAYLLLFPRARVLTLVPLFFLPWFIEIPAVAYLVLWFLSQVLNGTLAIVSSAQSEGGVAFWAHAGGFVAGAGLVFVLARRRQARER